MTECPRARAAARATDRRWLLPLALAAVALLVAGCGDKGGGRQGRAGRAAAGRGRRRHGRPRPVGLVTELPGRLEASRVAQVRARAAGIVQKRLFREGSDVKAGQPLFQIDSAPYQADGRERAGARSPARRPT